MKKLLKSHKNQKPRKQLLKKTNVNCRSGKRPQKNPQNPAGNQLQKQLPPYKTVFLMNYKGYQSHGKEKKKIYPLSGYLIHIKKYGKINNQHKPASEPHGSGYPRKHSYYYIHVFTNILNAANSITTPKIRLSAELGIFFSKSAPITAPAVP